MEDVLLREIDRIGEMMLMIARRLGLFGGKKPDYSISNVKEEFGKADLGIDLDDVLKKENPICYLVEEKKFSERALETFVEILFYSDIEESKKKDLLSDAIAWLDSKGYISFKLHSLLKVNQ
ncbi:MAG: hypothetical protein IKX26_08095 [Bacteroidales bacterium]|nr:hypothetical protein [Bacteroidales bacterium]